MKKNLLLAAALFISAAASAQEKVYVNNETLGIAAEAAPITGGTVLAQTENVTMSLAFDNNVKAMALYGSEDPTQGFTLGGQGYEIVNGITGSTNPTATITNGPTSGFVLKFDVKKDGFLYVVGKLSTNKPYYVWEGNIGEGERLVAYTLAMQPKVQVGDNATMSYTLPADDLGYFDVTKDADNVYSNGTAMNWPEVIVTKDANSSVKSGGLGIIKFPVFKDGATYYVHATGSKISTCGALFSETDLGDIAFTAEPFAGSGDTDGINDIKANAENVNAPAYNMAGQRVNNNFKGLMIKNGKKFINK